MRHTKRPRTYCSLRTLAWTTGETLRFLLTHAVAREGEANAWEANAIAGDDSLRSTFPVLHFSAVSPCTMCGQQCRATKAARARVDAAPIRVSSGAACARVSDVVISLDSPQWQSAHMTCSSSGHRVTCSGSGSPSEDAAVAIHVPCTTPFAFDQGRAYATHSLRRTSARSRRIRARTQRLI